MATLPATDTANDQPLSDADLLRLLGQEGYAAYQRELDNYEAWLVRAMAQGKTRRPALRKGGWEDVERDAQGRWVGGGGEQWKPGDPVTANTPLYHQTATRNANAIQREGFRTDAAESDLGGGGDIEGVYLSPDRAAVRDTYGGRGTITLETRLAPDAKVFRVDAPDYQTSQQWRDIRHEANNTLRYTNDRNEPLTVEEARAAYNRGDYARDRGERAALTQYFKDRGYDAVDRSSYDRLQPGPLDASSEWREIVVLNPDKIEVVGRSTGKAADFDESQHPLALAHRLKER